MDDLATANRVTNASDVGLIVQGSLILLSAIVALLGYSIQAKLKKKERRAELEEQHLDYLRKAELDLLRTKLRTFVGPATQLGMGGWNTIWRNWASENMIRGMGACEAHAGSGLPKESLNSLAGGDRVFKHWSDPPEQGGMGFTFMPGMVKGAFNGVTSFVGVAVESEIRTDPTAALAKHYFRMCRRVLRYYVPLRELCLQHSQTLDVRQSAAEFRETFPVLDGAAWLRNLLYIDLIEWVYSFEEIIKRWDGGDYALLFPSEVDFPAQLVRFLTNQLTELREQETALGTAKHKVVAESQEHARIEKMEAKSKSTKSTKSPKKKNSSSSVRVGEDVGGKEEVSAKYVDGGNSEGE